MAGNGVVGVDNLLHAAAYVVHVVQLHGVPYLQVHIVAVAHGNVDHHLAPWVQVVYGLAQYEEERARIVSRPRP